MGPPVSYSTPEHVEMSPPEMLYCWPWAKAVDPLSANTRIDKTGRGQVKSFFISAGAGLETDQQDNTMCVWGTLLLA